ncbi:response regulator [Cryptosporangium sp. NPDC048952]|uniref:response regulator n=1 Tax=Cryptosporangium sp. NPDC048952 TaxID=3363961 RepID=UPI003715D987
MTAPTPAPFQASDQPQSQRTTPIRVLLVDDEHLMRSGIAMILDAEPDIDVVAQASNGAEALQRAHDCHPTVVVMDVGMPVMDGVEATQRLTTDGFTGNPDQPVRVLILTTFRADEAVYRALRAGASGFVLKDTAPAQLVKAVQTIAAGDAWLDPQVTGPLITEFAARPERHTLTPAELQGLTTRERDVLILIAHGLSNTEIAAHLFIGEATVKTHFSRILIKLGLRDRAQAIAAAFHTGLVKPGSALPPPG